MILEKQVGVLTVLRGPSSKCLVLGDMHLTRAKSYFTTSVSQHHLPTQATRARYRFPV